MKFTTVLLSLAAAFAFGCSGMDVNHDYDVDADFASYKTYGWHESQMTLKDTDPLAHERLIAAIDAQMGAKGFQKASSNPDVMVTYNLEESEEMNLNTTYMGGGWGMGPGWGRAGMRGGMRGGMGMSASTTTVEKFNVGTLVLDMWDVEAHRLVWRGIASDTLSDNPKKNTEKIDKAAEKLFEKYPPASGD